MQFKAFKPEAMNKIAQAIAAGRCRDLLTHFLKLYPSTWTKKGHEAVFGKKSKKNQKKRLLLLAGKVKMPLVEMLPLEPLNRFNSL